VRAGPETEAYLKEEFSRDPSIAARLLEGSLPYATIMETGLRFKSDFQRREYNQLCEILDPSIVHAALEHVLGPCDPGTRPQHGDRVSPEHALANQFDRLYHHVLSETKRGDHNNSSDSEAESSEANR
jgi:hypothetical protein